jgi:hypothetical protein
LVDEEYVIAAAFIIVEIEGLKSPTGAAIGSGSDQRLEDRILSRNKANCRVQHLSARESAAEKSTLADLPRCA